MTELESFRKSTVIENDNVSYLDNGVSSKTVILFIHGNSMNAKTFLHQFQDETLSSFRLMALDLPGHGKSDRLEQYSIIQSKNAIKRFCETMNLKNFVIVAHSLGGHLCIQTLDDITTCKGLVLVGTPPVKNPLNLEEAFLPHQVMPLLFKKDLENQEADVFARAVTNQENTALAKKSIQQTDPNFREHIMHSIQNGDMQDEVNILKNYKLPIALIIGDNDAFVNFDYIKELNFPNLYNSKIPQIENALHSPHLDHPESFNRSLIDFISFID